jgi:hypothetical protein
VFKKTRDAPDIRQPDIRYPAGYQIGQLDIRPDIRLMYSWSNEFLIFFFKQGKKKFAQKLI